jgi:hypothetical protein
MIKAAFQPSEHWAPDNSQISREWRTFKEDKKREADNETTIQKIARVFFGRALN